MSEASASASAAAAFGALERARAVVVQTDRLTIAWLNLVYYNHPMGDAETWEAWREAS